MNDPHGLSILSGEAAAGSRTRARGGRISGGVKRLGGSEHLSGNANKLIVIQSNNRTCFLLLSGNQIKPSRD